MFTWYVPREASRDNKNLLTPKWAQEERNLERFILPAAWDREASDLLDVYSRLEGDGAGVLRPIVCQITGPKSSGKGTFARMLSNRLTTR